MILGGKSQQRARAMFPLAIAFLALAVGCSDDKATTGGTAGAGTGGAAGSGTGGASGDGGTGGTTGTGGAAGSAGSTGTGGAAGSAGSTGTGGAAGGGAGAGGSAGSAGTGGGDGGIPDPRMNFFVTSDTSKTGNLGGLTGADARCRRLASAVGQGSKNWHAYLSVEALDGGVAVNARDRIVPSGPYYNSLGTVVAADVDALHARSGDPTVFVDEHGQKINGQWAGSPMPVEHDVLTGSNADGTVMAGQTCRNWTSEDMADTAQVGHTDGLGPSMNPAPPYNSWNSSHANGGCNDTAPRGGAGRLYCFAIHETP